MKNRTKIVKIALTIEEYENLRKKAFDNNKPLAVLCRELAVNGNIIAPLTQEEAKIMRLCASSANSLNQIAKLMHQKGITPAAEELSNIINKLNDIMK